MKQNSKKMVTRLTPLLLAMVAGTAHAQPAVDGRLTGDESFYGPIRFVQTVPTQFGDNNPSTNPVCPDPSIFGSGIRITIDNSNTAGVEGDGSGFAPTGDPAAVTTGAEYRIPLSVIGSPTGDIRISGFISSGDGGFLSNQVIGGLPTDGTGSNLGEPRFADFSLIPGDQFVTVPAGNSAGTQPVLNGQRDASYTPLYIGANTTGFGDSSSGDVLGANGSEINGLYYWRSDDDLFIIVTGNLEANGNKLFLFLDTEDGVGQNSLRSDNPGIAFGALNRLGDDGFDNALTFDTDFTSNYCLLINASGTPPQLFADFAETLETGGGNSGFLGSGTGGTNALPLCPPTVPDERWANGSEINGLYAYIDETNNRLYVLVTGNLQNGVDEGQANKLNLFFDVIDGVGQNQLYFDNPDISFNGLNRMGDNTSSNNSQGSGPSGPGAEGLTFDTAFTANYWMKFHQEGLGTVLLAGDAAVLRETGTARDFNGISLDYGAFDKAETLPVSLDGDLIEGYDPFGGNFNRFTNYAPRDAYNALDFAITNFLDTTDSSILRSLVSDDLVTFSIDNSNIAGVTDSDVSDAANVTTGIELSIDLDELGWDGVSCIRIAGFISSPRYDFISNQVIGGLPVGFGNLAEPRGLNFATFDGEQFVQICIDDAVPCPCDYNNNGLQEIGDYFTFLTAFFAQLGGPGSADFDGDGTVTIGDYFAFLGCLPAIAASTPCP